MGRYRRRRSDAAQLLGDAAYIAQRVSYKACIAIGVAGFAFLYWMVPALMRMQLDRVRGMPAQALLEALLAKRVHWLQWIAVALLIIMLFFAWRQYRHADRLSSKQADSVSGWSRFLARWFD